MKMLVLLTALALAAPATAVEPEKAPKSAKAVVTAEVAPAKTPKGQTEAARLVLRINDKTEVLLDLSKVKDTPAVRQPGGVVTVTGVLTLDGKQAVLTAESVKVFDGKDKAPAKGVTYLEGDAICGKCDLAKCDVCTLAVKNAAAPVILDGDLAQDHADGKGPIGVWGRLFVDDRGLLRIEATKVVELTKK
jgi:hypothetical protein